MRQAFFRYVPPFFLARPLRLRYPACPPMKTKTHYPSYTLTVEDAFHYADSALLQELPDKGLTPARRR